MDHPSDDAPLYTISTRWRLRRWWARVRPVLAMRVPWPYPMPLWAACSVVIIVVWLVAMDGRRPPVRGEGGVRRPPTLEPIR